jgi:metal-dependent amidase/aminoacylase/carboxypeptidase family protein
MQEVRPGAYFVVGSRGGAETAFPHHNARFDIDERALEIGYRMMVALGLRG